MEGARRNTRGLYPIPSSSSSLCPDTSQFATPLPVEGAFCHRWGQILREGSWRWEPVTLGGHGAQGAFQSSPQPPEAPHPWVVGGFPKELPGSGGWGLVQREQTPGPLGRAHWLNTSFPPPSVPRQHPGPSLTRLQVGHSPGSIGPEGNSSFSFCNLYWCRRDSTVL